MIRPPTYRSPAALLDELGIDQPADIDVEAIAQYCGATVLYERLTGCEARVVGHGKRAIITVSDSARRPRQRFSAAHELGHWMIDRGGIAFACKERAFTVEWSTENPEQRANRFAAELLLPENMFLLAAKEKEVTFDTVRELAAAFRTSLTATAIRLVELSSFPSMLVCSSERGRLWFCRANCVPTQFWPLEEPGVDTVAHDLLQGKTCKSGPAEVYADEWFEVEGSQRYGVLEDSVSVTQDLVLSLLWWRDETQLLEVEDEDSE